LIGYIFHGKDKEEDQLEEVMNKPLNLLIFNHTTTLLSWKGVIMKQWLCCLQCLFAISATYLNYVCS